MHEANCSNPISNIFLWPPLWCYSLSVARAPSFSFLNGSNVTCDVLLGKPKRILMPSTTTKMTLKFSSTPLDWQMIQGKYNEREYHSITCCFKDNTCEFFIIRKEYHVNSFLIMHLKLHMYILSDCTLQRCSNTNQFYRFERENWRGKLQPKNIYGTTKSTESNLEPGRAACIQHVTRESIKERARSCSCPDQGLGATSASGQT